MPPKKPLSIDANTVLATKANLPAPPADAPQRSRRPSDSLVDLNFKVSAEFRQHFRRLAVDADLKNVQLLRRAVAAYERRQNAT